LYRWQYDQWEIKGRNNVILDFLAAQENEYTTGEDSMNEIFRDGFENGFYYADDPYSGETNVSELECPDGWMPDWVQGTEPGINHRPEFKPREGTSEVQFGNKCVGIHTTSASHDGVLYRQQTVSPGKNAKVTAWAMGKGEGAHGMVVGIDPLGGTDFTAPSVEWGEWWSTDSPDWVEGSWAEIFCEVIAQSSRITVFLRTNARYANSNAAHFDEVLIESEAGVIPPPVTGGIQDYIDALQRDLDALQAFVDSSSIKALPV
jgi:hypothetical protein